MRTPSAASILFLYAGFTTPAQAETLSLQEALDAATSQNTDLLRVLATREQAALARRALVGRAEPVLGVSASTSTTETKSFLAGQPLQTGSDVSEVGLSVSGRTPVGTTWSVSANHTYVDQLFSVDFSGLLPIPGETDAPQEQQYWTTSVGASLRQDLLVPFRRTADRRDVLSAREREVEAELVLEATASSTHLLVASAWWQWWMATERVAVSEASLARFERVQDRVRQSAELGNATRLDARLADQAVLEARVQLSQARAAAAAAEDDVLLLVARSPADDIDPGASDPAPFSPPSLEQVLRDNPEARRAELEVQVAERAHRDAQMDGLPALDAVLGVGYATLEESSGVSWSTLVSDPLPTYSAGVEMKVPLGRTAVRSRRESAAIQVEVARDALRAVRREVERSFAASTAELTHAELQVQATEASVSVARLELDVERSRVDEGTALIDAVLDAADKLRRAEVAHLEARVGVQRAQLSLLALAGRKPPTTPDPLQP
jgi:outer membrane protein TolC